MGGIFISYRRDDSAPYAGRLRDALSHHFGADKSFGTSTQSTPASGSPA